MTKKKTDDSPTHHEKIPVAIVGATGYTGIELIRLLLGHPLVELTAITSRKHANKKLSTIFPSFIGKTDLVFESLNVNKQGKRNNVIFLCLPHHESMNTAQKFRKMGVKVIDLSADFRFHSAKAYEKIYGKHTQKGLLKNASYGLPEIFGHDVKSSCLVGVPGCYVTSVILALAPLLQNQMIIPTNIICDSKSGTSGAGRSATIDKILAEVHGDFKAYGLTGHRHRPEMEEKLSMLSHKKVKITFTPHLLPISRGLLSTIYVQPLRKWKNERVTKVFKKFYKKSPFVHIMDHGKSPQIKNVVGTNNCQISVHYDDHSEKLIIISALDNLIKGASGQAVQCFNLMCGFAEDTGLTQMGIYP